MIGYLVCSLAGHDKNKVYYVVNESDQYVWLADGKTRTMEKPKRKNRKHVQLIKQKMQDEAVTNDAIKRMIKLYCKGMQEVK